MFHTVLPALYPGNILLPCRLWNAVRALHRQSSGNYPCCILHRPYKRTSRPLICRAFHGLSAYPQASVSGGIRWLNRSIPVQMNTLPVPPQSSAQILCTQCLQTLYKALLPYLQYFLSCQSGNPAGQGRSRPCLNHVLPLQRNSVFLYLSFQKWVLHFYRAAAVLQCLSFSYPLTLRISQSSTEFLPV